MTERELPGYRVPTGETSVEIEVRRSRFLATAQRAPSPEEARRFLDTVRARHPRATHHCWAFQAGAPGTSAHIGMSDAGEPAGTAGRPMLDVLMGSGVGEIVVVVSRWFGGTQLGKGGLARAYSEAVRAVLDVVPLGWRADRADVIVRLGYNDVTALRRLIADHHGVVESETYGDAVRYHLALPAALADSFRDGLVEATAGRVEFEEESEWGSTGEQEEMG